MHLLTRAALCVALTLALAACATQPPGGGLSGALTARQTFDRVCAERPTAYALFLAYDAVRPVPAETRRTVRVSNAQIAKACASPPANLAEAAAIVARAIIKIRNAIGKEG